MQSLAAASVRLQVNISEPHAPATREKYYFGPKLHNNNNNNNDSSDSGNKDNDKNLGLAQNRSCSEPLSSKERERSGAKLVSGGGVIYNAICRVGATAASNWRQLGSRALRRRRHKASRAETICSTCYRCFLLKQLEAPPLTLESWGKQVCMQAPACPLRPAELARFGGGGEHSAGPNPALLISAVGGVGATGSVALVCRCCRTQYRGNRL